MTDIHSHLIYGVDDGAVTLKDSEDMLKQAAEQGISAIIATPHYRNRYFSYPTEAINKRHTELKETASKLGIALYTGCEYYADSQITKNLSEGRVMTLADSEYVLCEFDHMADYDHIRNLLQDCILSGYYPVIAHPERYHIFQKDYTYLSDFRQMGCMLQLNAGSILGLEGFHIKRLCKRILDEGLADIVASDSHDTKSRGNRLGDCREKVRKKYGEETAERLFIRNPGRILRGSRRRQGDGVGQSE